ncbi:MAG: hypothetical protein LLG15_06045 [Betaproteobacteria bacterium]|nr:hypothetical protein [Betaproteobacteria bacterium]
MLAAQTCFAADISTASSVRFNIVCAKCHEGECSGRLSFDLGRAAAESHIERYAGKVSPLTRQELYKLLEYMKRECRYYPFDAAVPANRKREAGTLQKLYDEAEHAYFIPLGKLSPGSYRIDLCFDREAGVSAELISSRFEIEDFSGVKVTGAVASIAFRVKSEGEYYIRMLVIRPALLRYLEVVPLH